MKCCSASYNMAHKDIVVTDCPYRWFGFYPMAYKAIKWLSSYPLMPASWKEGEKSCIGLSEEGQRKKLTLMLVHEMTHHAQYERGFHEGNEVDTALSELYWLQEHDRKAFGNCFEGFTPEIDPPTIRRRRRGERLPWYLNNSGRNHAGYQR